MKSPRWCARGVERGLRLIGWLLITTVLLSMLKHIGSRWVGSLWLRKERVGVGRCGLQSERGTGPVRPHQEDELLRCGRVKRLQATSPFSLHLVNVHIQRKHNIKSCRCYVTSEFEALLGRLSIKSAHHSFRPRPLLNTRREKGCTESLEQILSVCVQLWSLVLRGGGSPH